MKFDKMCEELLFEGKVDYDACSDFMSNTYEKSTTKETIDYFKNECGVSPDKTKKFLKAEGDNYLKGKYYKNDLDDDGKIMKKYF